MKKNSAYLFVSILLISVFVFGQNTTSKIATANNSKKTYFDDRVIKFDKVTKTEEVIISIKEQTPIMELNINGTISYGNLNIELIDPTGERVRRLKIKMKSKKIDEKGISIGEINKFIKKPKSGNWEVKLSATKLTGEITIKANFDNDYYITTPEVFSPNGKGEIDTLNLKTYNISEVISFKIYDRWGKLVFSTKNKGEGWDGKVKNELQKSGQYFYLVNALTSTGKEVSKSGTFYLGN